MLRHYGFDLGDAESAVSVTTRDNHGDPEILPVNGAKSFISAFAVTRSGEVIVGENACYTPKAAEARLRFKSRFLTDPAAKNDILRFARGVLAALREEGFLSGEDERRFYIGCPAGWDANAREEYRALFEQAGFPPARIVTESRAALMSACQSKHLQVSYDILTKPMLVVDIGSSTTDFAYILRGKELELATAGEVFLGGGVMDEILLEEAIRSSSHAAKLREIFAESSPWQSYCEFAARRLKEKYFSDEDYWKTNECSQSVLVRYGLPIRLRLEMNEEMADKLQNGPSQRLGGKSFMDVLNSSLKHVRERCRDNPPEIVFLTGGVSRMPSIRRVCRDLFPDAIVVCGAQPEFSVSKGLAWTGAVEEDVSLFKKELADLVASDTVEKLVDSHIDDLFRAVVDELVEPILTNAAIPVFLRWRSGGIDKLSEIDPLMSEAIDAYLATDDARARMAAPIARWIRPVAAKLEEVTIPICVRHNVPYTTLSLTSYLKSDDIDVHVDSRNVLAVEEITWLINAIVSVLCGLLCGGSGVALIAGGLPGIMAGIAISLLLLLLGKNKVQETVMDAKLPMILRRAIPKRFFDSRIGTIKERVKQAFYENLQTEQGDKIRERLIKDISGEIEQCLTKMADVAEIPLG